MTQTDFIWDVCAGKHGGNPQSKAANLRIQPHKETARKRVFDLIKESGKNGATVKEIARKLGKYPNHLSGRITELTADGNITPSGIQREGCSAYVAIKDLAQ
jgi:AraC-like DNA-binding protein